MLWFLLTTFPGLAGDGRKVYSFKKSGRRVVSDLFTGCCGVITSDYLVHTVVLQSLLTAFSGHNGESQNVYSLWIIKKE